MKSFINALLLRAGLLSTARITSDLSRMIADLDTLAENHKARVVANIDLANAIIAGNWELNAERDRALRAAANIRHIIGE